MIQIDIRRPGEHFVPHWHTCVGAGRAGEGLRAAFQEHLELVQKHIGFRYLRFHGLFHDDMFILRRSADGRWSYNFQYVDELFDRMLEKNIRPFVELGFFPDCLKGGETTQFWWKANVTPPSEWSGWCALIDRIVRHWINRYGTEEVRQWYFEVWNEPNLDGFWDGTRSQYFEMYNHTVRTIKAIDPALRVGGPATSNFVPDARFDGEREDMSCHLTHQTEDLDSLQWHGVWIEAFLDYCQQHDLPVDFVSTHPYPTDFALDTTGRISGRSRGADALQKDLTWLRDVVRSSRYPDAEIHLTEWSSSPSSRDCTHDYLQEAAYIVKANLDCIGLTDSLSYWVFTDVFEELGAGESIFHGGFGLVNYQGIVKPGWHAYRMLAALGDECLYRDEKLFVTKGSSGLCALSWNYPISGTVSMSLWPDNSRAQSELEQGTDCRICFQITGLRPHQRFQLECLSREHGWALEAWRKMGSPEPPDRLQTEELRQAALKTNRWTVQADELGVLTVDETIEPWNLLMIKEETE